MLNLRIGSHRDLDRYYGVIAGDFDKKELLPKLSIHKAMLKGDMELCIIYDDKMQMDYAYALTVKRGVYGYVLLKYLGVLPFFRGQGVGVNAMRLINKHYADKQGILAELTVFDDEDDQTLNKLRKFFSRFGYVKLDVDYHIGGAEAELMVKPIQGSEDIQKVSCRMIRDLYKRVLSPSAMEKMIDIKSAD